MNKLFQAFMAHKMIAIPATALLMVGVISAGVVVVNHSQTKKEDVKVEAKTSTYDYTDLYKTAEFQLENSFIDEKTRNELGKQLAKYEKNVKALSKDEAKKLAKVLEEIEKNYVASEKVVTEAMATLEETYPKDENYYDKKFMEAKAPMVAEIDILMKEGMYKDAAKKINELNDLYAEYVKSKGEQVEVKELVSTSKVTSTASSVTVSKKNPGTSVKPSNTGSASANTSNGSVGAGSTSNSNSAPSSSTNTSAGNKVETKPNEKPATKPSSGNSSSGNSSSNNNATHKHSYTKTTKTGTSSPSGAELRFYQYTYNVYACSCGFEYYTDSKDRNYNLNSGMEQAAWDEAWLEMHEKEADAEADAFDYFSGCTEDYIQYTSETQGHLMSMDEWLIANGRYDKYYEYGNKYGWI